VAGIHEVAEQAGVSITTVSHVFSGKRPVAPDTRQRVLQAAELLQYRPNRTARGLATGRAMTIGLHFPYVGDPFVLNPYFPALLQGLSAAAAESGYGFLLLPTAPDGEASLDELIEARRLDGVIVADPETSDPVIPALVRSKVPLVTTGRFLPDPDLPWVDNDHAGAIRDMFAHLSKQGYRRPALLSHRGGFSYIADIEAAYTEEVTGRDMPVMIRRAPDLSEQQGYRAALRLLDRREPPDVIIACVDRQAIGVLRAADEVGLRVPEELGVAGEGDTVLAEHSRPPLTSIRVHPAKLGAAAVEIMLGLLEGVRGDNQMIPAEVVPRRSTRRNAAPPTPGRAARTARPSSGRG
jgi:DNA-binding LacI/PurR family transcriptional regulator